LAHELASATGSSPAPGAERDLGLELAKALGASVHRVLERTSAGEITLALANARARARDLDLDRDRTLAIALRPVLAIARASQRDVAAISSEGAAEVHRSPSAPTAAVRAEREDALRLIERAFAVVEARAPRGPAGDEIAARALIQELYGWLRLVAARKAGSMPAWEGIRLVRERPFMEPRARMRRPRSHFDAAWSSG